jgi:cation transport ATPase
MKNTVYSKLIFVLGWWMMITGCGFQQRKYTHGHYLDRWNEPTASHLSPNIPLMTENEIAGMTAIQNDTLIITDQKSSSPLLSNNDQDASTISDFVLINDMIKDTTIKGNKTERVDLPNQKEEPSVLNEPYKEAKKHVKRFSGISAFLFAVMVALAVSMAQSSGIYEESLYSAMLIVGLLSLATLIFFRSKWKKPYQLMLENFKSYRKFNENEKWYKAFDNKVFSVDFLIGMGLIFILIASVIIITPLYSGY